MDEPPREVSDRSGGDAWLRYYWLWDLYFAVGYLVVVFLMLHEVDAGPVERSGAITASTLGGVWYAGFGRALIRRGGGDRRSWVFVAGLVALFLVGVTFLPTNSFALFAVIPMVFLSLSIKAGLALAVPLNLVPPAASVLRDGVGPLLIALVPTALFGTTFSVLLGVWIARIISESKDRKELIAALEASRAEVGKLSHEAGVAAERGRLAAEIHDTLAQGFTSLLTLVQAADSELGRDPERARKHLELAARTARENLDEARALVVGLTALPNGTGSLDDAVRRQVDRLIETTGVRAAYRVDGDLREVPTAIEVVVLRTAQEAMTNVRKHADASQVSVTLRFTGTEVVLTIDDDGGGFDVDQVGAAAPSGPTGFGLRGMRARADQVDGEVTVTSERGQGTTVRLVVPL